MATTMSDLLQTMFRGLGLFRTSHATGGSTTTIEDANYGNNAKKNGTVFLIEDAAGAGAAPEGEYQRISLMSGNTITVPAAFTAAPAAGDHYGWANKVITLPDAIDVINVAVRKVGDIGIIDNTSLTTAASQTEYALPIGVKGKLLNVEIQGNTNDSNNNDYHEIAWEERPSAAGSTGLLIIDQQPSGKAIQLTYTGLHPRISVYTDVLQEAIPRQLADAQIIFDGFNVLADRRQNQDPTSIDGYNKAAGVLERAMVDYAVSLPRKKVKTFVLGDGSQNYIGGPGTARLT